MVSGLLVGWWSISGLVYWSVGGPLVGGLLVSWWSINGLVYWRDAGPLVGWTTGELVVH